MAHHKRSGRRAARNSCGMCKPGKRQHQPPHDPRVREAELHLDEQTGELGLVLGGRLYDPGYDYSAVRETLGTWAAGAFPGLALGPCTCEECLVDGIPQRYLLPA